MSTILSYYEHDRIDPHKIEDWRHTSRAQYLVDFVKGNTPDKGKVLDVGCGGMWLAETLPEYEWTGLDINTDLSQGRAVKHDIESYPYPFPDGSFDTVVCSETLEHVFDPVGVSKEIRRVIKPEGTYICSTPNFHWIDNYLNHFKNQEPDLSKPWTMEHIRYPSVGFHMSVFKEAGFQAIKLVGADAQFSNFFCKARSALRPVVEKAFQVNDEHHTITDMVMGAMFPLHSHTIMFICKPVTK